MPPLPGASSQIHLASPFPTQGSESTSHFSQSRPGNLQRQMDRVSDPHRSTMYAWMLCDVVAQSCLAIAQPTKSKSYQTLHAFSFKRSRHAESYSNADLVSLRRPIDRPLVPNTWICSIGCGNNQRVCSRSVGSRCAGRESNSSQ